jgi:hypothetical protein
VVRREVCSRGGYKVGNGINWKGQVSVGPYKAGEVV